MLRYVLILLCVIASQDIMTQTPDSTGHPIVFKEGVYLEPLNSPVIESFILDHSLLILEDNNETEWENRLILQQQLLTQLMSKLDSISQQQHWQKDTYEHQIEQLLSELTVLQSKVKYLEQTSAAPPLVDLQTNISFRADIPNEIRVYFNQGRSEIDTEALMILNEVIDLLAISPDAGVLITGCADDFSVEPQNLILSQKRAEEVRNMLISSGILPGRIIIRYLGSSQTQPLFRHQKVNIQFIQQP
jgi:outer membrane protein OmpA-like peptidoglycan-associated protein